MPSPGGYTACLDHAVRSWLEREGAQICGSSFMGVEGG